MKTADAVVIGAGINGASTAFNLLKRGLKKVVLVEKHLLGSGGTGRSAAIIRQHYSNKDLVKLVKRSVEIFRNFDAEIGGDCGFVSCGWAFLVPAAVSDGFSGNMTMLRELGIETREISKEELLAIEPRLDLADVHRIAYEPRSGYADPHRTTYSYVHQFRKRGGQLAEMTAVQGLLTEKGRIKGIQTDRGEISTEVVVNAAGPWSPRIAEWAGITLPIRVTREEEIILETTDSGGPPRLVFSDMSKAIYFRPEGATRTLVGRGFPKDYEFVDPDQFKESASSLFVEETLARLRDRVPAFKNALAVNAYTGLYDVTPDWYPILGKTERIDGFYLCTGFSGHGFKIGPAIGEVMAEEIVDGECRTVDLKKFNLSRFDKGELFHAAYGGNRA